MSRRFKRVITVMITIIMIISSSVIVFAAKDEKGASSSILNETDTNQVIKFNADLSIEEIVELIEQSYTSSPSVARTGEKWGESETVYDGQGGHYVTTRFWRNGDDIDGLGLNCVIRAEKQAVIAKYGSVSKNYEYKMETTQHIVMSAQTQGYITASAESTCYGRRLK